MSFCRGAPHKYFPDTYFIEGGVASEKWWLRFPPAGTLHAMAGSSPAVQVKAPRPGGWRDRLRATWLRHEGAGPSCSQFWLGLRI